MSNTAAFNVLLVEPVDLLRRTVSLTMRSLGKAEVTEAAAFPTAHRYCRTRPFDGAVIALEPPQPGDIDEALTLIQLIRTGQCPSPAGIPIAVLVESCNAELIQVMRACGISRILIKPFRVRDVMDTIDGMRELARVAVPR